jgi:hypothetical protein
VLPQPEARGLGLAIRQKIKHSVPLQVDQDAAVPMAAAPSPVIHAEYAWRRAGLWWRSLPAGQAEQRVGTDGNGQSRREPCAGLATEGEAEMPLQIGQPQGEACQRRRPLLGARRRSGADIPDYGSAGGAPRSARAPGSPARADPAVGGHTDCVPPPKGHRSPEAAAPFRDAATMMRPSGAGSICRRSSPAGIRGQQCLGMTGPTHGALRLICVTGAVACYPAARECGRT